LTLDKSNHSVEYLVVMNITVM